MLLVFQPSLLHTLSITRIRSVQSCRSSVQGQLENRQDSGSPGPGPGLLVSKSTQSLHNYISIQVNEVSFRKEGN